MIGLMLLVVVFFVFEIKQAQLLVCPNYNSGGGSGSLLCSLGVNSKGTRGLLYHGGF